MKLIFILAPSFVLVGVAPQLGPFLFQPGTTTLPPTSPLVDLTRLTDPITSILNQLAPMLSTLLPGLSPLLPAPEQLSQLETQLSTATDDLGQALTSLINSLPQPIAQTILYPLRQLLVTVEWSLLQLNIVIDTLQARLDQAVSRGQTELAGQIQKVIEAFTTIRGTLIRLQASLANLLKSAGNSQTTTMTMSWPTTVPTV
ncbi:uncharacterized protein LOC118439348 [Folsomia candida]|uniref:Putative valine--tRNA ligase, mitochondrial n=1 Tax=Folsomia candida TaxID=158441 RepID=A0A226D652_FOLCA|nr:uncharacterized protein LOC118439348 [Folsomia candida]OXA40338.1 putative valine--tRNA ligase, mitochondrial [Folsomia candida]